MWGFSPNPAPGLPYLCRLPAFLLGSNPFDLLDIIAFNHYRALMWEKVVNKYN